MESQHNSQETDIDLSEQVVPASLLSSVQERLARRQTYLQQGKPLAELLQALRSSQWEIRAATVHRLGEIVLRKRQFLQAPLLEALQDEHPLVRAAAIRALSHLGKDIPLEHILLALRDPAYEVREMAVLVLGEVSEQVVDPLQSFLVVAQQDVHSSVRTAATFAISH